ncbi:hypothetical protein HS041_27895 [Planomonospora sp. ID67723]|uniref:hypothetical protein n=1 Tax=Planomonospora sp. ID67723 TaxID=2738134 RepID=UPI0018C369A5|nr:hypothetical protein [Planomonospora sp. ID67723]MBG0831561.1 hypothetical protein [Planomonospora sp. ID67723]
MVATVTEIAATGAIEAAHATGAALRTGIDDLVRQAGLAEQIRLVGYDCFLGIETRDTTAVSAAELKTLLLQELIAAGALVRGIFYPTAAHGQEHVEATLTVAEMAAKVCGRALEAGSGGLLRGPAARRLL